MRDRTELPDHAKENHDELCPAYRIEDAWEGAECACPVIRVLRDIPGVDHLRIEPANLLEKIEREIAMEDAVPVELEAALMTTGAVVLSFTPGYDDINIGIKYDDGAGTVTYEWWLEFMAAEDLQRISKMCQYAMKLIEDAD